MKKSKENMYDISSKKCVTKKFLEVSRCGPAKQQTLDFIERFTFRLGSLLDWAQSIYISI